MLVNKLQEFCTNVCSDIGCKWGVEPGDGSFSASLLFGGVFYRGVIT